MTTRLLVVLLLLVTADACAVEPVLRNVDVRGLQVGQTTTIVLDGDEFGPAPRLMLPFAAKQTLKPGATKTRATFEVALDGSVIPGFYNLRVVTEGGVSLPLPIAIDALPQRLLATKTDSLPIALHGSLTGSSIVSTQFTGKAGHKVTIEVEAQRLGSKLRPVVHLYDAKRRQLAWAWAKPTLSGDARLQATLPADGVYTVSLHDAEYAGPTPGYFRLKLGEWSFAEQIFPTVVGKNTKSVQLLGPSSSEVLELPKTTSSAFLALPWPKAGTWSGPRPFVTVSDNEEIEAKNDGKIQDIPEGPVGISGRLRQINGEHRFRVAVKPGSKVRLEAYAERIGSPLYVGLVIRNDKGGQIARADEGMTTLDPALEYTVPPKETSILVGVVDSQGRAGPNAVYRLAIGPAAAPGDKQDFRLRTSSRRIILPDGGRSVVPVFLERRGYQGAIELSPVNLPAGVKVEGSAIPDGADGALMTVSRSGPFEPILTNWVARSANQRQQSLLVSGEPLEEVQPWLATELALAPSTEKSADFAIDWRSLPADLALIPGKRVALPVKVARTLDTSPVRLSLLSSQNIPLVNNQPNPNLALRVEKPTELAAKVADAELSVIVPPELSASSYDLTVQAELLSANRQSVLATAYAPVQRVAVRQSLLVSVTSPRIEAKLNPKAAIAVEIKGKVERREGLTGDVTLTLTGLPPGVTAPPVNVKAAESDFVIKINLPPNLAPGEVKGLKIFGTAVADPKQPNVRIRSRDAEFTLAILT